MREWIESRGKIKSGYKKITIFLHAMLPLKSVKPKPHAAVCSWQIKISKTGLIVCKALKGVC